MTDKVTAAENILLPQKVQHSPAVFFFLPVKWSKFLQAEFKFLSVGHIKNQTPGNFCIPPALPVGQLHVQYSS